jgi:hypothetical protein
VGFGHLWGEVSIYEFVFFEERDASLGLCIEASGSHEDKFLLGFRVYEGLWRRKILRNKKFKDKADVYKTLTHGWPGLFMLSPLFQWIASERE